MMITLSGVLKDLQYKATAAKLTEEHLSAPVSIVTDDSRKVRPGAVFVALQGTAQDGHRFASEALARGAVIVISEKEIPEANGMPGIPVLLVKDGREALACAAANFHGNPSMNLVVLGITGTSGKTTTSHLLESILKVAGHKVGVIGTVSIRYPGHQVEASQTTPGAADLQSILAEMKSAGCTAVVMEVSSHALSQKRVECIAFDAVVFTNLSPEHQDYHSGMDDYFKAKTLLFTEHMSFSRRAGKAPSAVVNVDDAYGKRLASMIRVRCLPFSLAGEAHLWRLSVDALQGSHRNIPVQSPLIGRFNAENILAALNCAEALQLAPETACQGIQECQAIPGRLERVPNSKGIHVFVDYAHKPDALEKVLQTLKDAIGCVPQSFARLITVFGCGGDRDRTKRPVMGRLAAEISDLVWVTSDNPRTEAPTRIIEEIVAGMSGHENYRVEPDRKLAIEQALRTAHPGDLVLIAGKGHETYQILPDPTAPGKTRKVPFDDREIAAAALT